MTVSMTELMRAVRNCFVTGAADGLWRVEGGVLTGDTPLPHGWVAIEGRGVFAVTPGNPVEGLPDGEWEGRIWLLEPPGDFLRLLEDINAWLAKTGDESIISGTVTRRRESFGVYATETEYGASGASGGWQSAFADRMAPYRRMFPEVQV